MSKELLKIVELGDGRFQARVEVLELFGNRH
jgi:hypothetical protein